MVKVKCKMTNCDDAEYDSELQEHICTYGPMCKILVLECEIDYLKKQFKSLYDAVDQYIDFDTIENFNKVEGILAKIDANKIFGGE